MLQSEQVDGHSNNDCSNVKHTGTGIIFVCWVCSWMSWWVSLLYQSHCCVIVICSLWNSAVLSKLSLCLGPDSQSIAFSLRLGRVLGSSRQVSPSKAGRTFFQPPPHSLQDLSPKRSESLVPPVIVQRPNNVHVQELSHCIRSSGFSVSPTNVLDLYFSPGYLP